MQEKKVENNIESLEEKLIISKVQRKKSSDTEKTNSPPRSFIRYTNSQKPLFFDPPPGYISSKKGSFKQKIEENKTQNKTLKFLLFVCAGIISIYPKFIMMAQSGIMEEIFPNEDYSFYVLIPTYIAIPPSMILIKYLSKTKITITAKLNISLFLSLILFLGCPYYGLKEKELFYEEYTESKTNFYLMLLFFLLMYIFCLCYQSYFTALLSVYHPKWSNAYFTAMAFGNIIVMSEKTFTFALDFTIFQDFLLIWGTYCLLVLFVMACLTKISKTGFYQENFINYLKEITKEIRRKRSEMTDIEREEEEREKRHRKVNYAESWRDIKGDAVGIFMSMVICFSVFPGMYFTTTPPTLISPEKYILILNIIAAIFDLISRPFAVKKFGRILVISSFYIGGVMVIFTIYIFLINFQIENEGVVYLNFVIVAFLISRTSLSISYYMINSNKKARKDTMEGIASIMTNILHLGVALGNILSNLFLVVKDQYFMKDY